MNLFNRERVLRLSLTLVILLSGVAMVPFVDLPETAISWEVLAGVYAPTLEVNQTSGAPGSVFAFTGTNYPPNSLTTIYVNGDQIGTVLVDGSGTGTFLLNTLGASDGQYNVTMEFDINASATQSILLVSGGQQVNPPAGFPGPVFYLGNILYLPVIQNQ